MAGGAKLTSGGNLQISASNGLELVGGAESDESQALVVAVGVVDTNTSVEVHKGAVISASGAVALNAISRSSLTVGAKAAGGEDGQVGIVIAVSDASTHASARLGADIGTVTGKEPSSVTVSAVNDIVDNRTVANAQEGASGLDKKKKKVAKKNNFDEGAVQSQILGKLTQDIDIAEVAPELAEFMATTVKAGLALTVASHHHTADATIGGKAGEAAPKIDTNRPKGWPTTCARSWMLSRRVRLEIACRF